MGGAVSCRQNTGCRDYSSIVSAATKLPCQRKNQKNLTSFQQLKKSRNMNDAAPMVPNSSPLLSPSCSKKSKSAFEDASVAFPTCPELLLPPPTPQSVEDSTRQCSFRKERGIKFHPNTQLSGATEETETLYGSGAAIKSMPTYSKHSIEQERNVLLFFAHPLPSLWLHI